MVPSDVLRLSAPVWMANRVFARAMASYREASPQVQLDVDLSGRMVNLVEERHDLVLRATADPDPSLITRKLTEIGFRLVASPFHLAVIKVPLYAIYSSRKDLSANVRTFIDHVARGDTLGVAR